MKKLLPIILGLALCSTASAALSPDSGKGRDDNTRRAPRDRELRDDLRNIREAQGDLKQAQQSLRNADSQREKREAREDVKDARNDLKRASKELKEDLRDRQNGSIRPRDGRPAPALLKRQSGNEASGPDRLLIVDDGGVGPVRPDKEIMEDRQKIQRAQRGLEQAQQIINQLTNEHVIVCCNVFISCFCCHLGVLKMNIYQEPCLCGYLFTLPAQV